MDVFTATSGCSREYCDSSLFVYRQMIAVRALNADDQNKIEELHSKYYAPEFELPDFFKKYLCAFAVTNDNDIVVIGGVRLIPEVVLLTDKEYPIKERREALQNALNVTEFLTKKAGFDRVHAVSENGRWLEHLRRIGFHSRGEILVLDLD